jgi:hypothetical protein
VDLGGSVSVDESPRTMQIPPLQFFTRFPLASSAQDEQVKSALSEFPFSSKTLRVKIVSTAAGGSPITMARVIIISCTSTNRTERPFQRDFDPSRAMEMYPAAGKTV